MSTSAVPEGGQKKVKSWVTGIVVFLLWLATSALGLVIVGNSREIVWGIYARFSTDPGPAVALGTLIFIFMAVLWLVYVIGSGEYHFRHAGQQSSWNIIVWAVAIELLILILYFVVAA